MVDEISDEEISPKKKKSWVLIIIVSFLVLFILGGAGVGVMYSTGAFSVGEAAGEEGQDADEQVEEDEQIEKRKPAIYIPLDPPFVVNFEGGGRVRFLQITVEAMTRDADVVEIVEKHMPIIRNNLVLLFSNQTHEQMSTIEGKEQLREEALLEIQNVLEQETGDKGIEALYFTSLVMQ